VQGGFHAIGDAAIGTVLAGFAGAARRVGVERLRAGRHRIEHVELADKAMIASMVEFGVVASVQPVFDRLWGGAGRMYEQRLGLARSLASNPIGALHAVGVGLAFGSDSPVTPLDPWGAVVAAARHANPALRLGVRAGFAAHTRGGWRVVHDDTSGVLVPGAAATFAVWDTPAGVSGGLPVLLGRADEPEPVRPVCRRTVLRGETIFEE
jgi:predicted amidohydrolase YtcJ